MNRKWAMRWAKALESGRYKQTRLTLENEVGFCCLGVLCKITRKAVKDGQARVQGGSLMSQEKVKELVGMRTHDGTIPSLKRSLAGLNDLDRASFKEIAKIIRKHYKEL